MKSTILFIHLTLFAIVALAQPDSEINGQQGGWNVHYSLDGNELSAYDTLVVYGSPGDSLIIRGETSGPGPAPSPANTWMFPWTVNSIPIVPEILSGWFLGFVLDQPGIWTVQAHNSGGGPTPKSIAFYWDNALGVEDALLEPSKASVFPNPSTGSFTVSSENTLELVSVFNAYGQLMSEFKRNSKRNEVELSNQPSGVYFLRIQTVNHAPVTKRIVVNHKR